MRGLVHDDGVLYVVALEGEDSNDRVRAERPLGDVEQLGRLGLHHRRLRVDQKVLPDEGRERVGGGGEAERLLRHGRLVGVPRRLVVLGIGDDRRGDAEHGSRVELEVGVLGGYLLGRHREEAVLLLVRVDELDDSPLDEVPPGQLSGDHLGDHVLGEQGLAVLGDDQRPHDPAGAQADVEPGVALLVQSARSRGRWRSG